MLLIDSDMVKCRFLATWGVIYKMISDIAFVSHGILVILNHRFIFQRRQVNGQ